tara:strand:+ start:869 stop:1264 length:396 start_codon:yes stop_codon:yes gene_type:complete
MRKFDLQLAGWMFGLSIVLWTMIASADHEFQSGPKWVQKPIQCASPPEVMDQVEGEDMMPLMQMNGNIRAGANMFNVPFIFFFNQKSESWYLVEFTNFEQACIVAVGQGINFDVQGELAEDGPPKNDKEGT